MSGNPKKPHQLKRPRIYSGDKRKTSAFPNTMPALRDSLAMLQERIAAVDAREHDLDRANIPRSALEHTRLRRDREHLEGNIVDVLARIECLERRKHSWV